MADAGGQGFPAAKLASNDAAPVMEAEPREMLEAKLWGNPCPLTFRLNYLALLYNGPLYGWVQDTYGLRRQEYVVLYSLALSDGGSAMDVSRTSGFPKNTLSRAIKRLEELGLIEQRGKAPGGGQKQMLHLSDKGWALFRETCPVFAEQEARMMANLSVAERQMLLELLSKVVLGAEKWAGALPAEAAHPVAAQGETNEDRRDELVRGRGRRGA